MGYHFKTLLVVFFSSIQYNLVSEELLQEQYHGASDGDEVRG